jgi:predicted nucleic acid-binding protein
MNVLVDTSVWSLALRRKPHDLNPAEQAVVSELYETIRDGRARIIGAIRQEVLSGMKESAQFERLRVKMRAFADEPMSESDYESAAAVSNRCRSKGIASTPVDELICATTIARKWGILTIDTDFKHYAKIFPIQVYPHH